MQPKGEAILRDFERAYRRHERFYRVTGSGVSEKRGRELKADLNDSDIAMLHLCGSLSLSYPEHKLTQFLIKQLKPADVFYDVGSNYGFYSYLASEFCAQIHTFEPLPSVFANLRRNFAGVQNVTLNNVAVTDGTGEAVLHTSAAPGVSTVSDEYKAARSGLEMKYDNAIPTKTIALDDYIKTHTPPTVVKLDVEGAEEKAIAGGSSLFQHHSPVVAMEVHSPQEDGGLSMRPVEKLRALGYRSHGLNPQGELLPLQGDLTLHIGPQAGFSFDNFIFMKA